MSSVGVAFLESLRKNDFGWTMLVMPKDPALLAPSGMAWCAGNLREVDGELDFADPLTG